MSDDTRALIRHLYFVGHVPLRQIAEHLRLSERATRGALVLAGGEPQHGAPTPLATALAASARISSPTTPHGAAALRRPTQRHR